MKNLPPVMVALVLMALVGILALPIPAYGQFTYGAAPVVSYGQSDPFPVVYSVPSPAPAVTYGAPVQSWGNWTPQPQVYQSPGYAPQVATQYWGNLVPYVTQQRARVVYQSAPVWNAQPIQNAQPVRRLLRAGVCVGGRCY